MRCPATSEEADPLNEQGILAAERVLRTAAPHLLLESLRRVLAEQYGAESAEFAMVDYGITGLQPVGAPEDAVEALPVHSGAPGRAFGSQQAVVQRSGPRTRLHLPVSVRGDRLGVLSLVLPRTEVDARTLAELQEIAQALGHAVVVAQRDTDVYHRARRRNRLTLAAEMQWELLPARSCASPEYDLGAQLEPAYAIYGDNFDWSAGDDRLQLYVTNGMGEGIDASLLTNLGINALRNARRAGIPIEDQAALADQAIYAQHRGERYLSVLLLDFDLVTGRVRLVDAGSPTMLRLSRRSGLETVRLDAQLPLGMFEETDYVAQDFAVEPGDRLVFVSDGVFEGVSPAGERYGEKALARAITATRLLPAADVPRAVLRELTNHRGELEPADDAIVVCLDWRGR